MPQLRAPDGSIVSVPDEQAGQLIAGGYEPVSLGEAGQATAAPERPDSGALAPIGAAASSFLSGASLGLSDLAFRGLLDKGAYERLAEDRAQHPIVSGAGQLAGAAMGGATPAGALGRATGALAEGGGLAAKVAAGGIEGSVFNAGAYLSDSALEDRELSAEGLRASLGAGFEFGAAGGAAALGIERGTIAARRMFSRLADGTERVANEAEQAWRAKYLSTIEAHDAAADAARARLADAQLARQQAQAAQQRQAAAVADARAGVRAPGAAAEGVPTVAGEVPTAAAPGAAPTVAGEPAPHPDVEIAGLLHDRAMAAAQPEQLAVWDAEHGQKLQSMMAARQVAGGIPPQLAELSARLPETAAGRAAALSEAAEAEIAAALREHDVAKEELERLLQQIEGPEVGQPGGTIGQHTVPVGEFGAPGAPGVHRLGEDLAPRPPTAVEAPTGDVTAVGRRRPAVEATPVEAPPQASAVPGATDTLTGQLRGMQQKLGAGESLVEMGAPARADYLAAKQERTAAASEHFRGKAIEAHEVPEYGAIKAHEAKADAALEQTIPARKIAARGYYEPPIRPGSPGMALEEADPVRMVGARKAIAEGQREAIDLTVAPSGRIGVTGGRHRLQAAIEADAPIKVKWSAGAEPIESDVLRHGAGAARSANTEQDQFFAHLTAPKTRDAYVAANIGRAMREEGSHAPALAKVEREWSARGGEHPLSVRRLEEAHDAAIERAATATEPAERAAATADAQAIGEQLTAVGRRPGAVEDIAAVAPVVTRYERAAAKLTETLGDAAPPAAKEAAQAFRAAEDAADRKTLDRTTRAIDERAAAGPAATGPAAAARPPATSAAEYNAKRRAAGLPDALAKPSKPGAGPEVAAARSNKLRADADLARARAAETEARMGSDAAKRRAAETRTAAEAARPQPPEPAAPNKLGSVLTAVAAAGELGVPGIPHPHDIPVIGPLLSLWTKYRIAKAMMGRFAGRVAATGDARAAAMAARAKDKIAAAVDRTLGLAAEVAPKLRRPIVLTATTLGHRLIDDGEPDAPKGASAQQLAAVRIREISAAATRPELVTAMVRSQLGSVADPDLIAAAEKVLQQQFQALAQTMPKLPPDNPYAKTQFTPSLAAAADLAQRIGVMHDPTTAFDGPTPAKADALASFYPKLFAFGQQRLAERAADLEHPMPYRQQLVATLIFRVPVASAMEPGRLAVLQSAHEAIRADITPAPSAPQPSPPTPSVAGPTNLNQMYQTSADRRAARSN